MAELSDELIMQRVKENNLSELAILFDRYHVRIYNFFLKLTFDKSISQDMTQNLFYRLIKYRHSFNVDNGSFKSWIYRMARNVHVDTWKNEKKMIDRFKNVDNYDDKLASHEETFHEDDFNKLDQALMKLNPEQLELIVLSRYQKLKYEEISIIKDISVPAIKVQIHRAMKQRKDIYFKQI